MSSWRTTRRWLVALTATLALAACAHGSSESDSQAVTGTPRTDPYTDPADPSAQCGDGQCDLGEDETTCPQDCQHLR